ncbi:MAG: O-antigen ligase family protein [Tenuifilaceae bacterium]
MLFTTKIHRFFFFFGLALSLCALPYSTFALSVGLIIVAINWLLDGYWVDKFNRFGNRKSLWFFSLVYFSIVIGVFYSSNSGYAIKELRLWLPLFLLPIILGTSLPLTKSEFKTLLALFCLSVFVASIISFTIYLKNFSMGSQNVRAISPFISHIRLALMIDLSIFILGYFAFNKEYFQNSYFRVLFLIVALWLIFFLIILQSFTGIIILAIVSFILLFIWIVSIKDIVLKFSLTVILVFTVLFSFSYLAHKFDRYFARNNVDFKSLPQYTINGNPYTHDTLKQQYENQNLVWINICYPELTKSWNKVSKLSFNSIDNAGQRVDLTLIRYLTSKGLTKDSVGIAHLDSIDIRLIENSVASVIYREHRTGIYPRLHQTFWEIDSYITRGAIGGSSLIQRYIYFKASLQVIKENLLFGVGTGDGPDSLKEHYKKSGVDLDQKYWYISHNQYLTVWIASGLVGLILFLIGLSYPFIYEKRYKYFLCLVFQIIILLSMLNEDTFETHIGVSFAALFYAILFFGYNFQQDNSE